MSLVGGATGEAAAATGGTLPSAGVAIAVAGAGAGAESEEALPSAPGAAVAEPALSPGPLAGTAGVCGCGGPIAGVAWADTAPDGVFRRMFLTVIMNRNGSMCGVDCRMLSISATWCTPTNEQTETRQRQATNKGHTHSPEHMGGPPIAHIAHIAVKRSRPKPAKPLAGKRLMGGTHHDRPELADVWNLSPILNGGGCSALDSTLQQRC